MVLWLQVQSARCVAVSANSADATETDNMLFLIRDEFLEWSLHRLAELLLAPVFVRRMLIGTQRRGLSALNPEAEALHRTVHSYGKRAERWSCGIKLKFVRVNQLLLFSNQHSCFPAAVTLKCSSCWN